MCEPAERSEQLWCMWYIGAFTPFQHTKVQRLTSPSVVLARALQALVRAVKAADHAGTTWPAVLMAIATAVKLKPRALHAHRRPIALRCAQRMRTAHLARLVR
jgi:hypothetical protein